MEKTRKNRLNDLLSLLKLVRCLLHNSAGVGTKGTECTRTQQNSILVLKIYFCLLILIIYLLVDRSSLLAGEYRGGEEEGINYPGYPVFI